MIPILGRVSDPLIIAHDVGRSRDRSTAVVGGNSPFQPRLLGIRELEELPQGLYGSARASALATIDRRYNSNALIVADLSNDATYAEVLFEIFGARVIGVQISRTGDGMNLSGGQSNIARCWSTPLAAPICSNCCTPKCKTIRFDLLMDR